MTITCVNKNSLQKDLKSDEKVIYFDNKIQFKLKRNELTNYSFAQNSNICVFIFGSIQYINNNNDFIINPAQYFLHYFENKLEEFLLYTEGSFLLLLYDKFKKQISAVRDSIGLMHIYYSVSETGFCLSDSINEVLLFREKSTISRQGLELYLTFQYIPQPFTFFNEIHQLPLNGSIIYKQNLVFIKNFSRTYIEMIDAHKSKSHKFLINILSHSLNRQLTNPNLKLGAFLSGGMDTSSNIGLLNTLLKKAPLAFTAGFVEQEYDETPYAKLVADYFKLKHIIKTIKPDILQKLELISSLYDNPLADRAILPEFIICQEAARLGIKYMISGEGGDEILGYPRNIADNQDWNPKHLKTNSSLAKFYYEKSALLNTQMMNLLLKDYKNNYNYLENLYESLQGCSPFEKLYYGQWQTWLIDNVYMKDIQIFKYFKLTFVSTYIDNSLLKHCLNLNSIDKIKKFKDKNYLKNNMLQILPKAIINKKKHKFHVPIAEWMRADFYSQIYDTLTAVDSIAAQFMDQVLIKEMLIKHKKGITDYNRPLWALYFLEIWYKNKKNYIYG